MITLQAKNVYKSYGDFLAVDNLNFEIRSGRIFGFLGPNGAGKTTTIRMIVGITVPDKGTIELFGQVISSFLQRRIGYLPEERGLYKKVKIQEQLRYFAALKGVSQPEADKRIDFWLDRMGLSKWKKKRTIDLSKGMQQKIQFIATILHDPDLLILDEPFSGLDPVNVESLLEVISELKAKGKTIIFSTHLMETAEKLCDDIILVNHARKIAGGTLREVKESFSKNLVAIRCKGGESILQDRNLVEKVTNHVDEQEVLLSPGISSQNLLSKLIAGNVEITKFEKIQPSLNSIFIEMVKETNV